MEKNNKKSILIGITSIVLVTLLLLGLTYAYYRTRIIGNESTDPSISVTSKKLEIVYTDGTTSVNMDGDIEPGFVLNKTFTVKNTGEDKVNNYLVYLEDVNNPFIQKENLKITLSCNVYNTTDYETNGENATSLSSCEGYNGEYPSSNDLLVINDIDVNNIHVYNFKFEYIDTYLDQSIDMNKNIIGKIQIYDYSDAIKLNITDDTYLLSKVYGLNIGDVVNYNEPTELGYTNTWMVMGQDKGQVQLISTDTIGEVTLTGLDGYLNGVKTLDDYCSDYADGKIGVSARSVKLQDINELTGYDPLEYVFYKGWVGEYGTTTTYSREGETSAIKAVGNGLTYDPANGINQMPSANVWSGATFTQSNYIKNGALSVLGVGESYTVKNEYYSYLVEKANPPYVNPVNLENWEKTGLITMHAYSNKPAIKVLKGAATAYDDKNFSFWLSDATSYGPYWAASWGVHYFAWEGRWNSHVSHIERESLVQSGRATTEASATNKVRAVVYLSSNVKLEKQTDGTFNVGL